ncbi:MAG: hemerythrin [Desulforhopalus sp.]|jgi:hemerythrin
MDIIKWRESYETGIPSLDQQHQTLIELINDLYKVLRKEKSNKSIEEVLDELTTYAEKHLQEEEGILDANGYADSANHIAIHQSYRDQLATLIAESKEDQEAAVQNTYTFLRQWWMGHIVAEDKKYGEFLKSKGVE